MLKTRSNGDAAHRVYWANKSVLEMFSAAPPFLFTAATLYIICTAITARRTSTSTSMRESVVRVSYSPLDARKLLLSDRAAAVCDMVLVVPEEYKSGKSTQQRRGVGSSSCSRRPLDLHTHFRNNLLGIGMAQNFRW